MSGDFDFEPVPGLPARLPRGERLLWQGSPRWQTLARRAFHVRKIAIYCGVLALWRVASDVHDGAPLLSILTAISWMLPLSLLGVGLPSFLAWLYARTTIYSITSRRVVIRSGVALPTTINIPFRVVDSAALKTYPDGTGDIPLALLGKDRIAYLHLWPNARPWRFTRPEPMLRALPDAAETALVLAEAMAGTPRPVTVRVGVRAPEEHPVTAVAA